MLKNILIFIAIIALLMLWNTARKLEDKGAWKLERKINTIAQQCYGQDQEVRIFIDSEDKLIIECKAKEIQLIYDY